MFTTPKDTEYIIRLIENQPRWIVEYVPRERQDEYALAHDELMRRDREDKRTLEDIRRVVRQSVSDWKNSPEMETPEMQRFAHDARLRYLRSRRTIALEAFRDNKEAYMSAVRAGRNQEAYTLEREALSLKRALEGYDKKIYSMEHPESPLVGITEDMIERAREYPLGQIIAIDQRGFALCVNHEEKTPSMYTKKNFAHCFGCQWSGDSIDVYRKVHECGFREAIEALQ